MFTFILLISTSAILLPYAASSAWLRSGGRNGSVPSCWPLLYSLYALSGAGAEALGWGAVLLLAGAPVYLWMKRRPSPRPPGYNSAARRKRAGRQAWRAAERRNRPESLRPKTAV